MKKHYDVFISYSRHNMALADKIELSLSEKGLDCFIDRETIEIGEDFAEKIGQSIYNSEVLLLIWTPESNQSANVAREIALATAYSKTIIPFQVGDFIPHYRMAYMLALVNRADKRQGFSDEELDKLCDKVMKSVNNAKQKRMEDTLQTSDASTQTPSPDDGETRKYQQDKQIISPQRSQRKTLEDQMFESEYELGCSMFREYRINEAFDLLLEPALADYRDARMLVHYCVVSTTRFHKISIPLIEDLMEREDTAENGFALYLIGMYAMNILDDYQMTYSYALKSMNAGSDYGTILYIRCHEFGLGVEKNFEKVLPRLRRLAVNGNPLAQYIYGRNLIYGWSCARQPELGFRMIKAGADKNDIHCLEALEYIYRDGVMGQPDPKASEDILNRLVEMGWVEALQVLGNHFCMNEDPSIKNIEKGYSYYKRGADLGEAGCMEGLGLIYENGLNGKANINMAIRWYERAANIGSRFAHLCLGNIYYYGYGGIVPDKTKAWEYFYNGATRYKSWDSYYMMCLMYYDGSAPKNVTEQDAVHYLQETVFGGGHFAGEAACRLYDIYHEGKVVPQDEQKGIDYLQTAAEYGYEDALLKAGKILTSDTPYAHEIKGIKYLTQAFEKGNVEAAILLAELYRNGMATVRDLGKAKEYLQFAINKEESPKALCEMGKLFAHVSQPDWDEFLEEEDISTEQKRIDQKIAIEYLTRAAEKGYGEAYSCLFSIDSDYITDDSSDEECDLAYGRMIKWAQAGADLNHPQSCLDLAVMYHVGAGVDRDIQKAEELYKRSIDGGNKFAPNSLASLYLEYYPERTSEGYYYTLLSKARGNTSSYIQDLEDSCIKNARDIEQASLDFDTMTFVNCALPRKIKYPAPSELTLNDFGLMDDTYCKVRKDIAEAYFNLFDYLTEHHSVPSHIYDNPHLYGDTPVIEFIDNLRYATAQTWKVLRMNHESLRALSFYDQKAILNTAKAMSDSQTAQLAAISVVEISVELESLYMHINKH